VNPWNSQYGKPDDGICTPYCEVLPGASRLVSFCASSVISVHVGGGRFGSRPTSAHSVDAWHA
ncbi:MAG: hypothetical protein ACKVQT_19025, partial [Burkholderiales bacterium]